MYDSRSPETPKAPPMSGAFAFVAIPIRGEAGSDRNVHPINRAPQRQRQQDEGEEGVSINPSPNAPSVRHSECSHGKR